MTPLHSERESAVAECAELAELIKSLPEEYRDAFEQAYDRAVDGIERRARILHFIQESLSQIRLDMKYLMFDLDATRRERDYFKQQLEKTR